MIKEKNMSREIRVYPSILSADFTKLGQDCLELQEMGCTHLHVDVMDGQFVPPISFGEPVIKSLRKAVDQFFDVHYMGLHPEYRIASMAESGADGLTIHAETTVHLDRVLSAIKDAGMEAGVALNPSTPLNVLDYVMDRLDQVLIMTVNPGYGGQSYLPAMTAKIRELREKLDASGHENVSIQVDGGIYAHNAHIVLDAGANRLVAGSGIFGGDKRENYDAFQKVFDAYR